MKKFSICVAIMLFNSGLLLAQVAVNTDGSAPDNSSMLDVTSTNRGLLIPRISTAARDQIPSPATGLLIYNSTSNQFNYYNGSSWYYLESVFISSAIGTLSMGGGVSINGSSGASPEYSAILDINNPTRGILIPGTTPELISAPATGLVIYNSSTNQLNYYNGVQWISLCAVSTGISGAGGSQTSVGLAIKEDNSNSHHSAILDISATGKGVLIPRLTNPERDAILPVTGLVIYNTSADNIEFYNGSAWYQLMTNLLESPAAGTHVPSLYQIIWNWNAVTGATGYKWNTTNNYSTAFDMGTATTMTETGLTCDSACTRYVWAYNTCGISDPLTMNDTTLSCCGQPLVDQRDGKIYNTVQIGTQCWMAESLNYGTMTPHNTAMTNNGVSEKYCFDNDELNCQEWGALYQWDEAMGYTVTESTQGICPASWHIPSEAEWVILDNFLGGYYSSGGPMKEAGLTHWVSPNTGGTNSSGFTGIASGFIDISASYPSQALYTHNYLWSSTEVYGTYARRRLLLYFNARSNPYYDLKWIGFSVRCVKD